MTREDATQELAEWIKQMEDHGVPPYSAKYKALGMAIEALQAEPVKHGKWEHWGSPFSDDAILNSIVCSVCGSRFTEHEEETFNFCPHCGARMNKEKEE